MLDYIGIVEQSRNAPITIGPLLPTSLPFLIMSSTTVTCNKEKRISIPLNASDFPFLFNLGSGQEPLVPLCATRELGQRRDTRSNSFQLLPQLHPNPILQLGPRLALGEACGRRDLAVWHVLAVGFRSYAGAIRERARTNLGRAGQDLYSDPDGGIVVVAVEFAVAEARRSEKSLASGHPTGSDGHTYPGATQFTMTPLELMGKRMAICLTMKTSSSFETL